jgi:UDP-3-O-[3-hydroxymyristoyl] glucosamine N-acyltransferase
MDLSLKQIAELVDGEPHGDMQKIIRDVAPFEAADDSKITFADTAKFYKKIDKTAAGAVIVPRDIKIESKNTVGVDNPKVAFAKLMGIFHPAAKPESGVSPNAVIGKNFTYGLDISIAPMVVIGNDVSLGQGVILGPGVVIGDNVVMGDDVRVHPNVTVMDGCRLGSRIIIHAGSVIGSDGYGFAPDGQRYYKIPQLGIVQIDDDVEIGACNTIDRATFGKTWIQQGVKTDNLVHIAHNVTVGENTVMVAQTAIAGSSTVGKHVALGGKAAVGGHVNVGDNVMIGAKAGVIQSVDAGEIVSGFPQMPHRVWLRMTRIIPRLPEFKKKLSEIEKRLKKLEN